MRSALRLRAVFTGALLTFSWSISAQAGEPQKAIESGVESKMAIPIESRPAAPVNATARTPRVKAKAMRPSNAAHSKRLRVVLPPGLIAAGASGQFGGGGRGPGMGGGLNGMGNGNGNGMGNGMGMGNGNGMGGRGMAGGNGLTLPPQVGMSMLSSLIVNYSGQRSSWNVVNVMPGMGGAPGLGGGQGLGGVPGMGGGLNPGMGFAGPGMR